MSSSTTGAPGPALGAEGWFDVDPPALVGSRCTACGTVAFPPKPDHAGYCPNPACDGAGFEPHRLATTGAVWSYTDARYQPPPPYVPTADPHEPFAIAAVELDGDGLVVLGQCTAGVTVADLHVGRRVELVVEPLFDDHLIYKWRPVDG